MKKTIALFATLAAVITMPALAQYRDRGGPRGPRAIIFTKPGFQGRSLIVDRPIGKLERFGFDDKPSSIVIKGGVWQICADDHFGGRCEIIDRSIPDLVAIRMDNKVSSIGPVGPRPGGPPQYGY